MKTLIRPASPRCGMAGNALCLLGYFIFLNGIPAETSQATFSGNPGILASNVLFKQRDKGSSNISSTVLERGKRWGYALARKFGTGNMSFSSFFSSSEIIFFFFRHMDWETNTLSSSIRTESK